MLRTKKTLRVLAMLTALVMAFSLTSVVAFADENTVSVAINDDNGIVVDDATGKITVTGTISVADADVTILALRGDAAVEESALGTMTDADLKDKIVYINQEAAVEGAYTFSFVPKADVSGGIITVFVGGEGVDTLAVEDIEVKSIAPTLTVADAELTIGDDLVITVSGLEAVDEAAWWTAVTSIMVGDTEITKADGMYADGAITITGLEADEYEGITIAATDYNEAVFADTITVSLKAAPTLAVGEEIVWSEEDVVITVTGDTAAAWLENVVITATTDADASVTAEKGEGTITLSATDFKPEDIEDVTVTVTFGGAAEYETVETVTITVVSPIKNIIDTQVQKPTVDKKAEELTKYAFVIPADVEGSVVYSYTIDGGEAQTEKTFSVERADGVEKTVVVKATITVEGYDPYDYTVETVVVKALGDNGPTVEEGEISISGGSEVEDAYGDADKRAITLTIPVEEVNPENETVMIGDVPLYYVEATGKYVGIIGTFDTLDELNDAITVVDGRSPKLIYGVTSEEGTAPTAGDYGFIKRILMGKELAPTEKQLLASDIAGGIANGMIDAGDYGALKRLFMGLDDDLAINSAE